jgi:hypothetical protein
VASNGNIGLCNIAFLLFMERLFSFPVSPAEEKPLRRISRKIKMPREKRGTGIVCGKRGITWR